MAAVALVTNDRTFATTGRAACLHPEKALRLHDVAGSAAVIALVGSRAWFRPGSGATIAKLLPLEGDLLGAAFCRFEKVDVDSRFDALALDRTTAASATSPASKTEPFKQVAEDVEDVVDVLESASAPSRTTDSFVTEAIIACPFLLIAENVVRLRGFFETFDRRIVTWVPIRVVLDRQLLKSLFDFIGRSLARHTQDLVIVAL